MSALFKNREQAGKKLAKLLKQYHDQANVLLLAIAKGGIDVAYPVAKELNLPLDILCIRKLRDSDDNNVILGAVATAGHQLLNTHAIETKGLQQAEIDNMIQQGRQSLQILEEQLRGKQVDYNCKDHTVIVIDDGIRTATTMVLALQVLKQQQVRKLIVATPVALKSSLSKLKAADDIVVLQSVDKLERVASAYDDFTPVALEDATEKLAQAREFKFHDFNLPKY